VAGAREHEHARVVVSLEALEGVTELIRGRSVDGIPPLAAVDRYESGGSAPLVGDELVYQPVR
jgi:hypothetical protein